MRHPCVFSTEYMRDEIDPLVQSRWKDKYGKPAPFGNLRQMWRKRHCATLNPYSSEDCPYAERECARAYLACVTAVTIGDYRHPTGVFYHAAKNAALDRADSKPRARDKIENNGSERPRDARGPRDSPEKGWRMRRAFTGPVHIGDLLRAHHTGPHPRPSRDREEEGKK